MPRFNVKIADEKVTVEDTMTSESETYDHAAFLRLVQSCASVLGEEYFHQALIGPRERLEHWISEVDLNTNSGCSWIPALETIHHHRFGQAKTTIELPPGFVVAAALTPEEEEKRKQMAFFKGSSHDPDDPWSPQRRS
jgi:hypothetical protein